MTNENHRPEQLSLNDKGDLVIQWSNGTTHVFPVNMLRDSCPCANCREKKKAEPPVALLQVLSIEETQPMKITKMEPVGTYAYGIAFSDGHDSGIFTLEHLFLLGSAQP